MSVAAVLEWLKIDLAAILNWVERHLGWKFFLGAVLTILVAVIMYLKQRRRGEAQAKELVDTLHKVGASISAELTSMRAELADGLAQRPEEMTPTLPERSALPPAVAEVADSALTSLIQSAQMIAGGELQAADHSTNEVIRELEEAFEASVVEVGDEPRDDVRDVITESLRGAYLQRGTIAFQRQEYQTAVDLYERAYTYAQTRRNVPSMAQALYQIGVAYGFGEDYQQAEKYFRRAAGVQATPQAYYNLGVTLGRLGRSEEEIGVYEEVVERFGEAPELALREPVAKALVNKGVRLGELERSEEAIGVYEEVVERFGEAPELALREPVAKALVNKGMTLGELERSEEEIGVYEEVVERFGEAPELALREPVAKALFNKGMTLGELERSEEAIGVYEEVVERFGEAPELALREQVAKALVNKGVRLGQLERSEEEIGVYEEVVERFGEAPELALREQVAKAHWNLAVTFYSEERFEEAKAEAEAALRLEPNNDQAKRMIELLTEKGY